MSKKPPKCSFCRGVDREEGLALFEGHTVGGVRRAYVCSACVTDIAAGLNVRPAALHRLRVDTRHGH